MDPGSAGWMVRLLQVSSNQNDFVILFLSLFSGNKNYELTNSDINQPMQGFLLT